MGNVEPASQSELVRRFIQSMPATHHLGIKVVAVEAGKCVLEMACRSEITFDGVVVQGGLVGVLADYAAVAAAGSTLEQGWSVATTSCETHNLLPATGTRLVAVGEIIHPAKRHLLARADVHIDSLDGPLCLTGLFTAVGFAPR